ncbi:sensor histidine kinase KdpD [uncultured Duncaniella sp.]|uniref:sensor histidine kinase n=1 Tax=uncultured Duncaniella sp. TaxID=2768039 RepID=UPI00263709A7|nr:HAMP domain-containing sensor histidine kinase [uncultured Duncaniella sp.]
MKNFKTVTTLIIAASVVAFVIDIICLHALYRSIEKDVRRDVSVSIVYMDIDELWERTINFSKLQAMSVEGTLENGSDTLVMKATGSDGEEKVVNKRRLIKAEAFTAQIVDEMSEQMHVQMDSDMPLDISVSDSILLRRLNERGINPDFVAVELVDSVGNVVCANPRLERDLSGLDVFEHRYGKGKGQRYLVYMSPLMSQVFRRMAGVVAVNFVLILIFAVGFRYLLLTVGRLRTLEELKDDFVNNMTHELKTPIAIAYSANDALLHFDTANDPQRKVAYLTIAIRQLKRLGELVESILAMSMERRQTMQLSMDDVELVGFVREIASAQRMRAEKPIEITVEAAEEEIMVRTDRVHFANVVNNLIDNAIKYSGESVEIRINCSRDGISVADNGIGIPAKSLPQLFNKFYRVPHGNCNEVRSYGIGLYYVRQILEKMGWTISVRSRLGRGSEFTIKFNDYGKENIVGRG